MRELWRSALDALCLLILTVMRSAVETTELLSNENVRSSSSDAGRQQEQAEQPKRPAARQRDVGKLPW